MSSVVDLVVLLVSCGALLVVILWRILNSVWVRPKQIGELLKKQGFRGNEYKLLSGDIKEMSAMMKQTRFKPIGLSDDIVPHILPFHHQLLQTYGKTFMIWFGWRPRIHVMDPELVRDVLIKLNDFRKPNANPMVRLLAKGLASYEGDQWAKHRKLINPAFHLDKLKNMLPAFELSCSGMIRKWQAEGSEGSFELDVWPDLQALTSDAISRTAFGSSYEEGIRIFKLQKEQAELAIQAVFSIYLPGFRYLPTKRNRRMKEIHRDVQLSLRTIIDNRLKKMKGGEEDCSDDLLGILLRSNMQEIEQHGDKSVGMSIQEVIDECKVFYFAGQETTSSLLVWTMVLLSQHQEWQSRAREEVFHAFGGNKPNYDGLNHLKVVTMILYEALRFYPPVVQLARRAHKDIVLGKYIIPSGVQIGLPILLIHRDKEIWGEDAKEFKPERFSEGISNATVNQQGSFFPFSLGPRICIGQNFALLEAKMALVTILQNFSFELSPSYRHAPYSVITLQPQYGAHLILNRIL